SMIVESGRGRHFYWVCPDIARDQFSSLQKGLIDKLGTDAAVTDLPRVMRLPGTLHLKDQTKPRLVKLCRPNNGSIRRWTSSEVVEKLKLWISSGTANGHNAISGHSDFNGKKMAPAFAAVFDLNSNDLSAGIEREEIPPLNLEPLVKLGGCQFIREALRTGGK